MKRLLLLVVALSMVVLAVGSFAAVQAQAAWAPNVSYSVGTLVTYGGHTYKCIQAHTSQVGWEPPNVPALWQDMGASGTTAPTNTSIPPTKTNTPGAPTATKTNTAVPTNGPTSTKVPATNTATFVPATATATSGSGGGTCLTPYVNGNVYTGGMQVSYNGHNWTAKWWTQNEYPSTGGSGVWTDNGTCSGSGGGSTSTPTVGPSSTTVPPPPTNPGTRKHALIGYWHDFDNGSGWFPITQVSDNYDVIIASFAAPGTGSPNGQMVYTPYNETDAQFSADIQTEHSRGKKVLVSSGGYVGSTFNLNDTTSMNNFITSMEGIISKYGFDGMDIDWEQNVLMLNAGDKDITHPTTPDVVNTINAITTIRNHFGAGFILTYGMETFFVQEGHQFYGGTCQGCDTRAGSLLPVIYATRGFTTYVQVQLYNSASIVGLDGTYYTAGGPDFIVAMTDMLLAGFSVAGTGQTFPALAPSQVAIGVPASSQAAGSGYVAPAGLQQAFDYLDRGISYGGSYHLSNSSGYPGLAGFMTWSINWDSLSGYAWSNPLRTYLNGLPN